MEVEYYKLLFLEKSLLGHKTIFDKEEEVIFQCIRRAYRDMLTVGRFYLNKNKSNESIEIVCKKFKLILEKFNFKYSRDIIDETVNLFCLDKEKMTKNRYATEYGLSQKLVTMTYKYFYVFDNYINKNIDFSNCDCPLDSSTLSNFAELKDFVWSKLTKEDYEYCQQVIANNINDSTLRHLGNLAFDFINW